MKKSDYLAYKDFLKDLRADNSEEFSMPYDEEEERNLDGVMFEELGRRDRRKLKYF